MGLAPVLYSQARPGTVSVTHPTATHSSASSLFHSGPLGKMTQTNQSFQKLKRAEPLALHCRTRCPANSRAAWFHFRPAAPLLLLSHTAHPPGLDLFRMLMGSESFSKFKPSKFKTKSLLMKEENCPTCHVYILAPPNSNSITQILEPCSELSLPGPIHDGMAVSCETKDVLCSK